MQSPRAHPCRRRSIRTALGASILLCAVAPLTAHAERTTASTGTPLAAVARLDFTVNIGKFIFLQVGADGTGINTAAFTLSPTIAPGPVSPVAGNNTAVNWGGAAPAFTVAASGQAVPVAVRSNAGQVTLRATTTTALTSGTNTIPMSQITLVSSDTNLPAPPLVDSGTGPSVNVTATAFSNLVTNQTATWTFGYTPSAAPLTAGTYSGRVTFNASAP